MAVSSAVLKGEGGGGGGILRDWLYMMAQCSYSFCLASPLIG